MGIKSKKVELVRGVKTFENIRKNDMKQKNQEVQIDYLCCKCKILPKFGNEIVKKYSSCSNLNFAKVAKWKPPF